jgi:hypothetical protein
MRLGFACTDRELLDALALVVDVLDPIPESLVAWAWSALAERADAVALRLLSDSVHVEPRGGARRVVFAGLVLRLDRVDGGLSVTGFAPGAAVAVLRWPGDGVAAAVGADGSFHVERVPFGPVRCVLRGAGRDRATPWFVA